MIQRLIHSKHVQQLDLSNVIQIKGCVFLDGAKERNDYPEHGNSIKESQHVIYSNCIANYK